ncbi:MAG TPA: hypothetical protein VGS22_09295 [Thermoanaerobaculia bacterium]|jgi:hypothetical protein|nr:hypothetical protein [Thermoanaerobaculia bacterium]
MSEPNEAKPTEESPALAAARRAREEQALRAAEPPVRPPVAAATATPLVEDPFRLCTYATLVWLAWIFRPPVVLAVCAILGFVAYAKALRAGLTRSRCLLRDTRLTLVYLGMLAVTALTWIGLRIAEAVTTRSFEGMVRAFSP